MLQLLFTAISGSPAPEFERVGPTPDLRSQVAEHMAWKSALSKSYSQQSSDTLTLRSLEIRYPSKCIIFKVMTKRTEKGEEDRENTTVEKEGHQDRQVCLSHTHPRKTKWRKTRVTRRREYGTQCFILPSLSTCYHTRTCYSKNM